MKTEDILRELPRLLKDKPELRYGLYAILSEVYPTRDEMKQVLEELRRLREDFGVRFEAHDKRFNEVTEELRRLDNRVVALGARWGIFAEEAFREGIKGILASLGLDGAERWETFDDQGFVHGKPSVIDVDLLVKDGVHHLIEVRSSVSRGDVGALWRKGELYKGSTGSGPRLVLVTPFIDDRARDLAERLGITVHTY